MATVEYVGGGITSAVDTAAATTTVAVPLFTGTAVGQPIILAVASDASSGSWTTPTGWTVLKASTAILSDVVAAVYYKYSSGAESSTVTVTGPSGHMVGSSVSLRCASSTSLAATIGAVSSSTSTTSPTSGGTLSPAIRTNGLAVRVYIMSTNSSAANATLTGPAAPWVNQQKFINSTSTSAFCTGICISTQPSSVSAVGATASAASAWMVVDSWWIDGFYPPISPSISPRMRSFNY